MYLFDFFFSSRRRHTRLQGDWSSDVCSSDLFTGKVVMTKGDFVMRADQMVVHFDGTPPTPSAQKSGKTGTPSSPAATDLPTFGNRAINLIDATGNVFMQRGEKRAKSKKAVYHQRDETLVLTGDPEAWEEGYRVTGTKMTMFLREDRSRSEEHTS